MITKQLTAMTGLKANLNTNQTVDNWGKYT